jgi:hypothetical protein
MKRIIAISGLLLMTLGIFSCQNQKWSFPNFDYTTTYFPNQFPVRTLIFDKNYIYDNSMDNNMQFLISATTGGVYKQGKVITVGFTVDNTLANNLINTVTNLPIKAMPSGWYSFDNPSQIVIPAGKFAGGVTVTLTNDFTADTNSVYPYWAIPLRMTSTTADSILQGRTGLANPDSRIAANWAVTPKDFTIFALRYVNEWHGKYLLRGTDIITQGVGGAKIDSVKYHTQYLEGNAIIQMLTSRRNRVLYENSVKRSTGSPGNFQMRLDFDANDITLATMNTTTKYPTRPVAGTAKMVLAKDSPESWGNVPRNTIYLAYTITVGTEVHNVKDTLVFRDKAVLYTDFTPKVVVP